MRWSSNRGEGDLGIIYPVSPKMGKSKLAGDNIWANLSSVYSTSSSKMGQMGGNFDVFFVLFKKKK